MRTHHGHHRVGTALGAGTTLGLVVALAAPAGTVQAVEAPTETELAVNFTADGYTLEDQSPAGQNDWNGWDHGDRYDWALVDAGDFPESGLPASTTALRFSNFLSNPNNGGNINQLTSPLIAAAGESGTGASHNAFGAEFTVASATGEYQEGLNVQVAIDDGQGRRTGGGVSLRSVPEGLEISTYDLPSGALDWRATTLLVEDFSPHTITLVTVFVEDGSDTLAVYVDDTLAYQVGTYEGYHDRTSGYKRQANSLLFRTGRTVPDGSGVGWTRLDTSTVGTLDGAGFLFSDIYYESFDSSGAPETPDSPPPTLPATPTEGAGPLPVAQSSAPVGGTVTVTVPGFDPYENVYFAWYSDPVFAGWFRADSTGTVTAQVPVATGLGTGTHTLQAVGAASGLTFNTQLTITAAGGSGGSGGGGGDTTTSPVSQQRLAGADRFATSAAVAAEFWAKAPGGDVVIVANGEQAKSGADALAASFLAGRVTAPVVLVGTDTVPAAVTAALQAQRDRLGRPLSTVYVLGGTDTVSSAVADALAPFAATVERVAGADRFATAAAVATATSGQAGLLGGKRTVLLANGWSPVDALVAGPLAYRGLPVLLTDAGSLPAQTAAAIKATGAEQVVVLGAQASVSDAVADQVRALGVSVQRVGGADRFATAALVNALAVRSTGSGGLGIAASSVTLADGWSFADALSAGPLAGVSGAVIVPVGGTSLPAASAAFLRDRGSAVTSLTVLGGTDRIPVATLAAAVTALG